MLWAQSGRHRLCSKLTKRLNLFSSVLILLNGQMFGRNRFNFFFLLFFCFVFCFVVVLFCFWGGPPANLHVRKTATRKTNPRITWQCWKVAKQQQLFSSIVGSDVNDAFAYRVGDLVSWSQKTTANCSKVIYQMLVTKVNFNPKTTNFHTVGGDWEMCHLFCCFVFVVLLFFLNSFSFFVPPKCHDDVKASYISDCDLFLLK